MKTKGNFLSYIASEKKQRKGEVKTSAHPTSYNEYSRSQNNNMTRMDFKNEMSNYQMS